MPHWLLPPSAQRSKIRFTGWRRQTAALMFTRKGNNLRRFGDVQDNAMYWNFVVGAWLPIYVCIYWIPRL